MNLNLVLAGGIILLALSSIVLLVLFLFCLLRLVSEAQAVDPRTGCRTRW